MSAIAPRLSDAELGELLALVEQADSVELKLRMTPPEYARRLVTEVWFYPDGSRILELSAKCAPPEAFTVVAETRAFLGGCGIDTSGEQHTKTKQALEFFAGRS